MEQTVTVVQQGRGERECHSSPGGLGMEAAALTLVAAAFISAVSYGP